MSEMDVKALQANFSIWKQERASGLPDYKAFERYVFEQVLKDYEPADEDLDIGDLGAGDDGGVDGMFLYIGGQLIGEETVAPLSASDVELHIIQAKHESGFKETAVEKLESFAHDMLDYHKEVSELTYLNSKARDAIGNFRAKYESILGKPHTLAIVFHYACMATEIPSPNDKVMARADNLKAFVKTVITLATVEFSPWAAPTLLESARSVPSSRAVLPFERVFSTGDQSTVCLVKLTDFAQCVLRKPDGHLQTRFLEPNVRDYQGRNNPVNSSIRKTLEEQNQTEDFWWLNNGITILASGCGITGDQVTVDNPEIVNGLQTSHEIFNWYKPGVTDHRRILVRVIVATDDNARSHIIKATNSQTRVSELSLLSTEPIQQTIEDRLRLHGLYYDRKKGQARRLKRAIKSTVGMRTMAQAVIAIALRYPDQARARPQTYVKDNAAKVFDPHSDGDLYVGCIILDRQVEEFLNSSKLESDKQRDIRYYMGTLLVSVLLETRKPTPDQIATSIAQLQAVKPETMEWACEQTLAIYTSLGASDKIAKSPDMVKQLEQLIEKTW